MYTAIFSYQKVFDRVQHELMEILQRIEVRDKEIWIVAKLYSNQGSQASELMMLIQKRGGNSGEWWIYYMNNLRYADDTVIFSDSTEGLQQLTNKKW